MMKMCQTCYGYGLWAVGDPVPMGPIDAMDGLPTISCPECGANAKPVDELLTAQKTRSDDEQREKKRKKMQSCNNHRTGYYPDLYRNAILFHHFHV